jgi:hypothetical protein
MFGKKQSALDVVRDLGKATHNILQANAYRLEQIQDAITEDHNRILDYFWNRRTQKLRRRVRELVIWFFETDDSHETLFDVIRSKVHLWTLDLEDKKYITSGTDQYGTFFELTPKGVAYVKDRHPTVLAYWKRLLELSPPTLSLIVAIIGFLASVFGIVQFVFWLQGK